MSDQETRDRGARKRQRKPLRKGYSTRPGPRKSLRRKEPFCDDYAGEARPDPEYAPLNFHENEDE